jgi:hypothetical protein
MNWLLSNTQVAADVIANLNLIGATLADLDHGIVLPLDQ